MRIFGLLFLMMSFDIFADEIQSVSQHISIRKQNETGRQQDLLAKITIDRKFDLGLQGTYLERFDLYEKRAGAFLVYRPQERWNLEFRYLQGIGSEILPERQSILSAYYAWAPGLTPFVFYRDTRYSSTHLHTVSLGLEIEKIPHLIFIPTTMLGKATFNTISETEDVHSFGLKIIYYSEQKFSFSIFGYKGQEASQGVVGRSSEMIDTLSGGITASVFLASNLKSEIILDHTDYDQLNNQFQTTTLNLTWML